MKEKTGFWFFFLVFLLFTTVSSTGQGTQGSPGTDRPVRVEIPARSTEETYHIVPVHQTGVLLYYRSVETLDDTLTKWYFSLYDTDLHPVWVKSLPVRTGLEVRDSYLLKDTLSLLFIAGEKTKGIAENVMIVHLDCKTGKFTGSQSVLNGNVSVVKFLALQERTVMGYNLKNEPAHIRITEKGSGKVSDYP